MYYVLDENDQPQPCPELTKWARWMAKPGRHILGHDKLPTGEISTIFLGINRSFTQAGPPVLWETMVFGGKLDGEQIRYTSKDQALAGHRQMVDRVRREG